MEAESSIVIEWRESDADKAQQKIEDLMKAGWVKDGPAYVKSGTFTDLYQQAMRREKDQ